MTSDEPDPHTDLDTDRDDVVWLTTPRHDDDDFLDPFVETAVWLGIGLVTFVIMVIADDAWRDFSHFRLGFAAVVVIVAWPIFWAAGAIWVLGAILAFTLETIL